jgi:predicted transposase YbfD/YdcC
LRRWPRRLFFFLFSRTFRTDIAEFGEKKPKHLRRFRGFRDGTRSHDHLGDIFAILDAADVGWLQQRHSWPGLNGVLMVESEREIGDKLERETCFYVTSSTLPADQLGPMIRDYWSIENSLHWVMDMTFRDDECRIRTKNAPAKFATLRHMAHNLLRKAPGKDFVRLKRKTAAWDDDFLASLIAA